MKKTFYFNVPNKKPERQIEAIRHEIKKYFARERRKDLPEGATFWNFQCRIGLTEQSAQEIPEAEIKPHINQYLQDKKDSFYLEILAVPGKK